jgi:hypothetical protein
VSAFWPAIPAKPIMSLSDLTPKLEARGEVDEGLSEAAITAIILGMVACLIPLAVLLVRMSRKSRLV